MTFYFRFISNHNYSSTIRADPRDRRPRSNSAGDFIEIIIIQFLIIHFFQVLLLFHVVPPFKHTIYSIIRGKMCPGQKKKPSLPLSRAHPCEDRSIFVQEAVYHRALSRYRLRPFSAIQTLPGGLERSLHLASAGMGLCNINSHIASKFEKPPSVTQDAFSYLTLYFICLNPFRRF